MALLSTKILVVSQKQREEILGYKIAPPQKVVCIPLGLELDPFLEAERKRGQLRRELNLGQDHKLVGIIARLVPVKGHRFLFEAALRIKPIFPQIRLLVVGDGSLRRELEDLAAQLDIQENVIFCGFRRDLPKIYADLDVVVLTSLNEGLPVAIIESMAAARPVVAFDVGGVRDLVRDNVTGILVPFGDVQKLADSMISLLRDPQKGKSLGQNARQRVYPHFDYRRLVRDMEKLYCQLLKNKLDYAEDHQVDAHKELEGAGVT